MSLRKQIERDAMLVYLMPEHVRERCRRELQEALNQPREETWRY